MFTQQAYGGRCKLLVCCCLQQDLVTHSLMTHQQGRCNQLLNKRIMSLKAKDPNEKHMLDHIADFFIFIYFFA